MEDRFFELLRQAQQEVQQFSSKVNAASRGLTRLEGLTAPAEILRTNARLSTNIAALAEFKETVHRSCSSIQVLAKNLNSSHRAKYNTLLEQFRIASEDAQRIAQRHVALHEHVLAATGGSQATSEQDIERERLLQEQEMVEADLSLLEDAITDRDARIRSLARDTVELHDLFLTAGEMVRQGGEDLGEIEDGVISVKMRATDGRGEIQDAMQSQRKGRSRTCLLFLIILLFACAAVILVYFKLIKKPKK